MGFPHLLRILSQYTSEADVTWYGHAKGVSSEGWGSGVRRWTSSMYSALLDYWPEVQRQLQTYAAVGVWKKRQGWFPLNGSTWHYMGSHRWVRNRDLYVRRWDEYIMDWCCPEAHTGGVLRWEEAGCLYGECSGGPPQLYLEAGWPGWADEEQRQREEAHMKDRQCPILVTVVICSHKKPQYVHQAIRSVIGQTTDSWRLVVVDSGPLIDAGEFARYSGDPRIACIRSGEDRLAVRPGRAQGWCHNRAATGADRRRSGLLPVRRRRLRPWTCSSGSKPPRSPGTVGVGRAGRARASGRRRDRDAPRPARSAGGGGRRRRLNGVVDGMQLCVRRLFMGAGPRTWPALRGRTASGWTPWPTWPRSMPCPSCAAGIATRPSAPLPRSDHAHRDSHGPARFLEWRPGLPYPDDSDLLAWYWSVAQQLRPNPVCVEIGVAYGRSLLFLALRLLARGDRSTSSTAWIPSGSRLPLWSRVGRG